MYVCMYISMYGAMHTCNHPVYNRCALYQIGENVLSVIQQRFDEKTKKTWWGDIDPWLTEMLYLHQKFKEVFDDRSVY